MMQYQYNQRLNFAVELCRLGLCYLYRRTKGGADFKTVLNGQTPIYRLTILWDKSQHPAQSGFELQAWDNIQQTLFQLYKNNIDCPERFEGQGLELLIPVLESRVERDIAEWPWLPSGYVPYRLPQNHIFGIFAYDPIKNDMADTVACMTLRFI